MFHSQCGIVPSTFTFDDLNVSFEIHKNKNKVIPGIMSKKRETFARLLPDWLLMTTVRAGGLT